MDGYHIEISKKVKNGITGTYVDVILEHNHLGTSHQILVWLQDSLIILSLQMRV